MNPLVADRKLAWVLPAAVSVIVVAAMLLFPYASGYGLGSDPLWRLLLTLWNASDEWKHGMFVFPIASVLIFLRRTELARVPINSRPQFDPLIGTLANSVRLRKINTAAIGKTNIPCFHSSEAFQSVRSRRQRGSEPRPYPLAYGKRSIAATTITLTAAGKTHASLRSATRGFIRRKLDYILARHCWIVTISLHEP